MNQITSNLGQERGQFFAISRTEDACIALPTSQPFTRTIFIKLRAFAVPKETGAQWHQSRLADSDHYKHQWFHGDFLSLFTVK